MKIFNYPFFAGLAFGCFMLFTQWLSTRAGSYLNIGTIGTTSFFTLFPCAMVLLYYQQLRGHNSNSASLKILLLAGVKFILAAAMVFALAHFINASFIDPQWGKKALESAKEDWAARGYSKDAIAGQVEQEDIFQHPFNWSLVLFVFYCITYGLIHLFLAPVSFWFWKWWKTKK